MAPRRDLPGWLAAVHPRFQVPHRAEAALVVSILVLPAAVAGKPLPDQGTLLSWALLDGTRLAREIESYYRPELRGNGLPM